MNGNGRHLTNEEIATASLRRKDHRKQAARDYVLARYVNDDDVVVDDDAQVDWVDGGYWVAARVFVPFEPIEDTIR